jgi:hypothetical protein
MGRSLLLSRHCRERHDIHGDSKVTGGEVAAAALERHAIAAIVNVTRVIAPVHIALSLSWGARKVVDSLQSEAA